AVTFISTSRPGCAGRYMATEGELRARTSAKDASPSARTAPPWPGWTATFPGSTVGIGVATTLIAAVAIASPLVLATADRLFNVDWAHLSDVRINPASRTGVAADRHARHVYTNLLFKYLEMGYVTGLFSERSVRGHVREAFRYRETHDF